MFPLWNFFLSRRQFTYLLVGVLFVGGVMSALVIRKESSPEIIIPVGIITTTLPGASAEEVEKLITNKIEERLTSLGSIQKVTSTSREGVSIVTAEFAASAPVDQSIRKLKDEVDRVKPDLPTEANDPIVSEVNFTDQPVVIVSISTGLAFGEFGRLADRMKDDLQSVAGVSRVDVQGVRNAEVQVIVEKEELARYGLSMSDVINAIRSANVALPAGKMTVNNIEYTVRFEGDLATPSDVGLIALPSAGGPTLYLRDVAIISDGVEDPTTLVRLSDAGAPSEQAFTLNIYKASGADVTAVAQDIRDRLAELQANGALQNSQVVVSYDSGELVKKDLSELTRTGLETVALVMICLLITIGWRESLIAGLAIPLSFLIAFIGLYYSGNTINFISLFSLILAIGILVDAGIVIVEGMAVRLARHHDPIRAARETVREFSWPLIAGTATTIGVFVPLFFISGVVGKFIAGIPYTIIFVLIASTIVALGIIPLFTSLLIRENTESKWKKKQEYYAELARKKYETFLRWAFLNARFQKRFFIAITVGFFLAILAPVSGLVKVEFFPGDDSDFIYLNLEMPAGTPLTRTDLSMRGIEEILYEHKGLDSIVTTIGASNAFDGSGGSGPQFANALILLPKDRRLSSDQIAAQIRSEVAHIAEGKITVASPAGGPPVGAPVLIQFTGEDLAALGKTAQEAARILETQEGVLAVTTSGDNDSTEFVLTADRGKLAELGLTPAVVAQALRSAIYGTEATTINTFGDDIKVNVRANLNPNAYSAEDATRATFDAIKQIPIATAKGQVLLGSLVAPELGKGSAAITHEDRKRIVSVSATLTDGANARDAVATFTSSAEKNLALPEGVAMKIGGENEETNKSFLEMFFAFIAGIFLMYAVVVLEFNSFRLATYTLIIVPLSLIGVMAGLLITFKPLSFPSLLGMIALGGVIINHAIILIDAFVSPLRKEHDTEKGLTNTEKTLDDYIITAAASRLRPIFLTTITTAMGMIPLSFAAPLWAPLAYTIMFGLIFGTILTLVFIPLMLHRSPGRALLEMMGQPIPEKVPVPLTVRVQNIYQSIIVLPRQTARRIAGTYDFVKRLYTK